MSAQEPNPRKNGTVHHLLKWPGGKRWLAPCLAPTLRAELEGRYFEPFAGAAAMYLELKPTKAVLSDINGDLVETLMVLQRRPHEILERIWRMSNEHDCYYRIRAREPNSASGRAARFIYLNRTAWGGMQRHNRDGEFNVPFGDSGRPICRKSTLLGFARSLKGTTLLWDDFEVVMEEAGRGDVIYADPPYGAPRRYNGFRRYNDTLFSWKEQIRLANAARRAARRGTFVAVSGHWTRSFLALYRGWWAIRLRRHSRVSRDTASRGVVWEATVVSRKPKAGTLPLDEVMRTATRIT
jgi:DNA adenine methylase